LSLSRNLFNFFHVFLLFAFYYLLSPSGAAYLKAILWGKHHEFDTNRIYFFCVLFCGAMLGLLLHKTLPKHHFGEESKDAIKMGIALLATLTALVLGLFIRSTLRSYDEMGDSLAQGGARIILLDRSLADYGPQTKQIRGLLRRTLVAGIAKVWPEHKTAETGLSALENAPAGMAAIADEVRRLVPQNHFQRMLQTQAMRLCGELLEARWLTIEQTQVSLPTLFLVVLCFWLAVLFVCIGLLAPANKTVIAVLLACAMSAAGAVFLMYDTSRPLEGVMKVSPGPLLNALEHLK
jgi:hypothetical protein